MQSLDVQPVVQADAAAAATHAAAMAATHAAAVAAAQAVYASSPLSSTTGLFNRESPRLLSPRSPADAAYRHRRPPRQHPQASWPTPASEAAIAAREAAAAGRAAATELQTELDALLDEALLTTALADPDEPRRHFAAVAARLAGVHARPSVHTSRNDASVQCYLSDEWGVSSIGENNVLSPAVVWGAATTAQSPDPRKLDLIRGAVASLIESAMSATIIDFPLLVGNVQGARERLASHLLFATGLPWPGWENGPPLDASLQVEVAARHDDPLTRAMNYFVDRERMRAWAAWVGTRTRLRTARSALLRLRHQSRVRSWLAWRAMVQECAHDKERLRASLRSLINRQLVRGWSAWVENATESTDDKKRLRASLRSLINRQLVRSWSAWVESTTESTTKSKGLGHMLHREQSRGWLAWVTHVEERAGQVEALRKAGKNMKDRSLLRGFSSWRSRHEDATAMARGLGYMKHGETSRMWRTWQTMAEERRAFLQQLEQSVLMIIRRKLLSAFATWDESLPAKGNDPMARAMRWFLNRSLSRGWSAWHAVIVASADNPMAKAFRYYMNSNLARGWSAWAALLQMSKVEDPMVRGAGHAQKKAFLRGWHIWTDATKKRNKDAHMARAVRYYMNSNLAKGWSSWAVMVATTTEEALMARALRYYMNINLAQGWSSWLELVRGRLWNRGVLESCGNTAFRRDLARGLASWREFAKDLLYRKEVFGSCWLHALKRDLTRGWAAWVEITLPGHARMASKQLKHWLHVGASRGWKAWAQQYQERLIQRRGSAKRPQIALSSAFQLWSQKVMPGRGKNAQRGVKHWMNESLSRGWRAFAENSRIMNVQRRVLLSGLRRGVAAAFARMIQVVSERVRGELLLFYGKKQNERRALYHGWAPWLRLHRWVEAQKDPEPSLASVRAAYKAYRLGVKPILNTVGTALCLGTSMSLLALFLLSHAVAPESPPPMPPFPPPASPPVLVLRDDSITIHPHSIPIPVHPTSNSPTLVAAVAISLLLLLCICCMCGRASSASSTSLASLVYVPLAEDASYSLGLPSPPWAHSHAQLDAPMPCQHTFEHQHQQVQGQQTLWNQNQTQSQLMPSELQQARKPQQSARQPRRPGDQSPPKTSPLPYQAPIGISPPPPLDLSSSCVRLVPSPQPSYASPPPQQRLYGSPALLQTHASPPIQQQNYVSPPPHHQQQTYRSPPTQQTYQHGSMPSQQPQQQQTYRSPPMQQTHQHGSMSSQQQQQQQQGQQPHQQQQPAPQRPHHHHQQQPSAHSRSLPPPHQPASVPSQQYQGQQLAQPEPVHVEEPREPQGWLQQMQQIWSPETKSPPPPPSQQPQPPQQQVDSTQAAPPPPPPQQQQQPSSYGMSSAQQLPSQPQSQGLISSIIMGAVNESIAPVPSSQQLTARSTSSTARNEPVRGPSSSAYPPEPPKSASARTHQMPRKPGDRMLPSTARKQSGWSSVRSPSTPNGQAERSWSEQNKLERDGMPDRPRGPYEAWSRSRGDRQRAVPGYAQRTSSSAQRSPSMSPRQSSLQASPLSSPRRQPR